MSTYNRYNSFVANGSMQVVPFVAIPKSTSDIYVAYRNTRLDLLSYKYYGDANYGWLILQANPELGAFEYKIPQNTILRIPYPLDSVLSKYETNIANYKKIYGLE